MTEQPSLLHHPQVLVVLGQGIAGACRDLALPTSLAQALQVALTEASYLAFTIPLVPSPDLLFTVGSFLQRKSDKESIAAKPLQVTATLPGPILPYSYKTNTNVAAWSQTKLVSTPDGMNSQSHCLGQLYTSLPLYQNPPVEAIKQVYEAHAHSTSDFVNLDLELLETYCRPAACGAALVGFAVVGTYADSRLSPRSEDVVTACSKAAWPPGTLLCCCLMQCSLMALCDTPVDGVQSTESLKLIRTLSNLVMVCLVAGPYLWTQCSQLLQRAQDLHALMDNSSDCSSPVLRAASLASGVGCVDTDSVMDDEAGSGVGSDVQKSLGSGNGLAVLSGGGSLARTHGVAPATNSAGSGDMLPEDFWMEGGDEWMQAAGDGAAEDDLMNEWEDHEYDSAAYHTGTGSQRAYEEEDGAVVSPVLPPSCKTEQFKGRQRADDDDRDNFGGCGSSERPSHYTSASERYGASGAQSGTQQNSNNGSNSGSGQQSGGQGTSAPAAGALVAAHEVLDQQSASTVVASTSFVPVDVACASYHELGSVENEADAAGKCPGILPATVAAGPTAEEMQEADGYWSNDGKAAVKASTVLAQSSSAEGHAALAQYPMVLTYRNATVEDAYDAMSSPCGRWGAALWLLLLVVCPIMASLMGQSPAGTSVVMATVPYQAGMACIMLGGLVWSLLHYRTHGWWPFYLGMALVSIIQWAGNLASQANTVLVSALPKPLSLHGIWLLLVLTQLRLAVALPAIVSYMLYMTFRATYADEFGNCANPSAPPASMQWSSMHQGLFLVLLTVLLYQVERILRGSYTAYRKYLARQEQLAAAAGTGRTPYSAQQLHEVAG